MADEATSAGVGGADETTWSVSVDLSPDELSLIRTALHHLLASEEDPDEVHALKALLAKLPEVEPTT